MTKVAVANIIFADRCCLVSPPGVSCVDDDGGEDSLTERGLNWKQEEMEFMAWCVAVERSNFRGEGGQGVKATEP